MEIQERFQRITGHLDEKTRRLWCANEALAIPYGGVSLVSRQTGVSRTTITEGVKEIKGEKELPKEKIRRSGGGRKLQTTKEKKLKSDVKKAVESSTRGDPESPLKWCSKSIRNIANEINKDKKD